MILWGRILGLGFTWGPSRWAGVLGPTLEHKVAANTSAQILLLSLGQIQALFANGLPLVLMDPVSD